ncbi:MAG: hypothetical protein PHH11_02340 [Methylomonas sp.]|nr:hypothetical protein [Methylomonas sp.]
MILPPNIIPLLEQTLKSPLVPRGTPLEIWKSENHRSWIDIFTELGIVLFNSDLPADGLPRGYILVAYLFDWEAQCQFDGWHAFGNRSSTIDQIIKAYEEVGLKGEADALRRAHAAWERSNGDMDATSMAYGELRHEYSVDLDRLEFLVCYFIDNAEQLFYVTSET